VQLTIHCLRYLGDPCTGKKRKKKEKKLRGVTSHIFAQTTHVALPHQSRHVGWGPGRCQPCRV